MTEGVWGEEVAEKHWLVCFKAERSPVAGGSGIWFGRSCVVVGVAMVELYLDVWVYMYGRAQEVRVLVLKSWATC